MSTMMDDKQLEGIALDFTRIYEARAVECLKCGNWEETGAQESRHKFEWFKFHEGDEHFQCKTCGTHCTKESMIREGREDE